TGGLFSVLRTCVLYGTGKGVKTNFFLWVYKNLMEGNPVRIVTDQYNNPTLAEDLAAASRLVWEKAAAGIHHIAGPEYINRYDFAMKIADVFNLDKERISPITTIELGQQANRPLRGGLKTDLADMKLGFRARTVQQALTYLKTKMEQYG
ncbi:MAG: sugar nucleotide-binding protein, partial [Calditrichia bacterium]